MFVVIYVSFCSAKVSKYFSVVAGNGEYLNCKGEGCYPLNHEATKNIIGNPQSIFVDAFGNLFIYDIGLFRILKVDVSGTMTTIAGNGEYSNFCCDGADPANVGIGSVFGLTGDADGNIFFSEASSHRIRMISNTTGTLSTVAGKNPGIAGFSYDGVVARGNYLSSPQGLQIDSTGNIYFADRGTCRIRFFYYDGGTLQTILGDGSCRRHNGQQGDTALEFPYSIALDSAGRVYFTEDGQNFVRRIELSGDVSIVAGNGTSRSPTDGVAPELSSLSTPHFLAIDNSNNVFVTAGFNMLRAFNPFGDNIFRTLTSFTNSIALDCSLNTLFLGYVAGVAVNSAGEVFVSDASYRVVYKITDTAGATCSPSTMPTIRPTGPSAMPTIRPSISYSPSIKPSSAGSNFTTPARWISTFAGNGGWDCPRQNGSCTGLDVMSNRPIAGPYALFIDKNNDDAVYVAVLEGYKLYKILQNGSYFTVAGNGSYFGAILDNVPASSTSIGYVQGITGDANGNIYFSEVDRHLIRKIDKSGIISTVAGILPGRLAGFTPDGESVLHKGVYSPGALQYDSLRNRIFFVERSFCTIRAFELQSGIVETLVGTLGCQSIVNMHNFSIENSLSTSLPLSGIQYFHARMNSVTNEYDLFVPDSNAQYVYQISLKTKRVHIFAGDGTYGYVALYSPASSTAINSPYSVTSDSEGNIFIGMYEGQVKIVNPDGIMYPYVSGQYPLWDFKDCVYATSGGVYTTYDIAVDSKGNLYVADYEGYRVRKVTEEQLCGPTMSPSTSPTGVPTNSPTAIPTLSPTVAPSVMPTLVPTFLPTAMPTFLPTFSPFVNPSLVPTITPSQVPSCVPTFTPSAVPSAMPSHILTEAPTASPTTVPTLPPSAALSGPPSVEPSYNPTPMPSELPSLHPSLHPSTFPTLIPSLIPSTNPTIFPTASPSIGPSNFPTVTATPSIAVTVSPSLIHPSQSPTFIPSYLPTLPPSAAPSMPPSVISSLGESFAPSQLPTVASTAIESVTPTTSPTFPPTFSESTQPIFILLATLTSDGVYGEVILNSEVIVTDISDIFPCSRILSFPNSSLLSCQWTNSTTVRVLRSAKLVAFEIDQSVMLRSSAASILQPRHSQEGKSYTIYEKSVLIRLPSVAVLPIIVISSHSSLVACADWILDFSPSRGNAKRSWAFVNITIEPENLMHNSTWKYGLERFLNNHFTTFLPMRIPSSLLSQTLNDSISFGLKVKLCNYLGGCSLARRELVVSMNSYSKPVVSFVGVQSSVDLFVNQSLRLSSSAFVPLCGSARRNSHLRYSWKIADAQGKNLNLLSDSLDPSKFVLAPFSLLPGSLYNVSLIVIDEISELFEDISLALTTKTSDLVVGTFPSFPSKIGSRQSLFVDAAMASFDPDEKMANLHCDWQIALSEELSQMVLLTTRNSTARGSNCLATLQTTSNINTIVSMQLTLSVRTMGAVRKEKSLQLYTELYPSQLPIISILSSSSSLLKLDPSQAISISASILSPFSTTAKWSERSNSGINMSAIAPSSKIPANLISPAYFYLLPNSLSFGKTYTFQLSSADSIAVVSLGTNAPPYGGSLSVVPSYGYGLETIFAMVTQDWEDEDLPLSFSFRFSTDNATVWLPLQPLSSLTYVESYLPAGMQNLKFAVHILVDISDSYGLSYSESNIVVVQPSTSSTAHKVLMELLNNVTLPQEVLQVVSLGSAVAQSSVNCSMAGMPFDGCQSLFRENCRRTSHTCGSCLAGYVGIMGDSNIPCFYAQLMTIISTTRRLSNNSNVGCATNSDCHPWQVCDSSPLDGEKSCFSKMQECPNQCTGHGHCSFRSLVTFRNVSTCSVIDPSCVAMCLCNIGFSGEDCSIPSSEKELSESSRGSLLSSLQEILPKLDTSSTHTVEDIAAIVYTMTSSSSVVNNSTVIHVLNITEQLLSKLLQTESSDISASTILGVAKLMESLNSIGFFLFKESQPSYTFLQKTITSVERISNILSKNIVPDSESFSVTQPFFRTTLQALSIRDTNDGNYSFFTKSASLPLELLQSKPVPSININRINNEYENAPAVSVNIQLSEIAQGFVGGSVPEMVSNIISLETSFSQVSVISTGTVVEPSVGSMELFIPHNDVNLDLNQPIQFTVNCTSSNLYENVTYLCPGSNVELTIVCNGSDTIGVWTKNCPVKQTQCSTLASGEISDTNALNCRTLESTLEFTRCQCQYTSGNRKVRRLEDTENSIYSAPDRIAVLTAYVAQNFGDSFAAAKAFDSTSSWEKSVIVIVLYGSFWFICCLLMMVLYFRGETIKAQKLFDQQQKQLLKQRKKTDVAQITLSTKQMLQESLLVYIKSVIPTVFEEKPVLIRLAEELTNNHLYLNLITKGLSSQRSYVDLFRAMTVFTVLMFLLAMMYDLQYPDDDGSCVQYRVKVQCLHRKSILDSSLSYCVWVVSDSMGTETCEFNSSDRVSFSDAAICAIVTSWFSSLFTRPLDFFFGLLLAPSIEEVDRQQSANKVYTKFHRPAAGGIQPSPSAGRLSLNEKERKRTVLPVEMRPTLHMPEHIHQAQKDVRVLMLQDLQNNSSKAMSVLNSKLARSSLLYHRNSEQKLQSDVSVDSETEFSAARNAVVSFSATQVFHDMYEQRRQLEHNQCLESHQLLEEFDRSWELLLHPDRFQQLREQEQSSNWIRNGLLSCCGLQKSNDSRLTLDELIVDWKVKTYQLSQEYLVSNEFQSMTESERGIYILQIFLQDVIGRDSPAAKIFVSKSGSSIYPAKAVSHWLQRLAVLVIVLVNLFCMFYSVLKGYQKGVKWQRAYAISCCLQLVSEIIFFETLEAFWVEFLVPNLVYKEIFRCQLILKQLVKEISQLLLQHGQRNRSKEILFNVPSHFYVSHHLAKRFPTLVESMMLLSYESYLPIGLPFDTQYVSASQKLTWTGDWYTNFSLLVSSFASLFIAMVAIIPTEMHRVVLRFFGPFLMGGLALLWKYIVSDTLWLLIFIIVLGTTALYFVWTVLKFHFEASRIRLQIIEDSEHSPEDEIDNVPSNAIEQTLMADLNSSSSSMMSQYHVSESLAAESVSNQIKSVPPLNSRDQHGEKKKRFIKSFPKAILRKKLTVGSPGLSQRKRLKSVDGLESDIESGQEMSKHAKKSIATSRSHSSTSGSCSSSSANDDSESEVNSQESFAYV